jgi:quercetin dioxygenase-like cupin family protein
MPAYSLVHLRSPRGTTRVLFLRKDGETLQFLSTSHDTRNDVSEIIFSLPSGGDMPQAHRHVEQTEHVEVLSGEMRLVVNNEERSLQEGEQVTIAPNEVHSFGNSSQKHRLIVRVSFRPALNIEWYFTQLACSAIRNGGGWKDVPLLEWATIHYAVRKEYRLARYPGIFQDLFFGTLTFMAKITGAVKNIRPLSLYKAYVK